jgi:hypothetical protein
MQHVLFFPQLCFHTLIHYWKHIHFCPIIFLIILLYLAVIFWERKALFACFGHVGRHEQINKTWWERVGKSHLCLSFRKYHCYIIHTTTNLVLGHYGLHSPELTGWL